MFEEAFDAFTSAPKRAAEDFRESMRRLVARMVLGPIVKSVVSDMRPWVGSSIFGMQGGADAH